MFALIDSEGVLDCETFHTLGQAIDAADREPWSGRPWKVTDHDGNVEYHSGRHSL